MLSWVDRHHFVVGETAFRALLPGAPAHRKPRREGEFLIFKPRPTVDYYAALVADLRPQRIFELGVRMGGSTVFFTELARPQRLVAIDRDPLKQVADRIQAHATHRGFSDVVRTFGDVDQADRPRLARIAQGQFDGQPLDLVVDDCSHLYEPTRASFNELFPRLRPGGAFVIEDWRWAHPPLDSDDPERVLYPDQVPLTRLLFEIVLAMPSVPGLIDGVSIRLRAALIRRGDAEVDPSAFEISASSNARGRALLAQ